MAQTLEQINALRFIKGEEPLTELPAGNLEEGGNKEGESKIETPPATPGVIAETPEEIEAKRKLAEKNDEKPPVTPATSTIIELDDNAILEALKKRGIAVESFDDLLPKEVVDPAKLEEQKEADKLSFALSKGLFSKKDYENYVRDTNDTTNFVYGAYYAEAKKENPELTDDEIQNEFLAEHGLDADPSSAKYKRAVRNVAVLADKMLKDKYGKIYAVDQEFERHETAQKSKSEYEKKIIAQAPAYKKDVEDVLKDLTKIIVPFSDEESLEATFTPQAIETLKNQLLEENYSVAHIAKGWEKENLKNIAYTALVTQNLVHIVKDFATQYLYKNQAGSRGIPKDIKQTVIDSDGAGLTDRQKEALEEYRSRMQLNEVAN